MALRFNDPNEAARWYSVDDGVMGGHSKSGFHLSSATGVFSGQTSLEDGGGFASVRREPEAFEKRLAQGQGIALTARGDGRTYQLRLKSSALEDASAYRIRFTPETDEWQTFHFTWAMFEAVRRGTLLDDAPALDPAKLTQLGFLIADKKAGEFALSISEIDVDPNVLDRNV